MLYTSLSTGCCFHAKPTSLTICFSYVPRPRGLSQNCWGFWPGGDSAGIGSEHLVHQDEHLYSKLPGQLTLQIACNHLPDSVWEASIKVEKSQAGDVCCTTEFSEPSKHANSKKNAIFHTYIPVIQDNYGPFPHSKIDNFYSNWWFSSSLCYIHCWIAGSQSTPDVNGNQLIGLVYNQTAWKTPLIFGYIPI